MDDSCSEVMIDAAEPRTGGSTVHTLIGTIGELGFLVKHISADSGQGSWRRFGTEQSLVRYLRSMALPEIEVQRILRDLVDGRRVVLSGKAPVPARRRSGAGPARKRAE
jgi:hypothetical protein